MNQPTELFPEVRFGHEVDQAASSVPLGASFAMVAGGLLGLAALPQESELTTAERAWAASAGVVSTAAGALLVAGPAEMVVALRRGERLLPILSCAGAVLTTAFGGGHRSPAYFPAVLLTALGTGIESDRRWGMIAGTGVALGYLAGCGRSLALRAEPMTREGWNSVALSLGFLGAGALGTIAGDLSLRARALGDSAAREQAARRELSGKAAIDEAAEEVRRLGREFLDLLPQIGTAFASSPAVGRATAELATALATLRNADERMAGASARESLGTWTRLRRLVDNYNAAEGDVRVVLTARMRRPPSAPVGITNALVDGIAILVQNAANARGERGEPVRVRIALARTWTRRADGRRRRCLTLTVEDDAGGARIPPERWGRGLMTCDQMARDLGGSFALDDGEHGLRAVMAVPDVREGRPVVRALTYVAQFEDDRDRALAELRAVTAAQALFMVLARTEPAARRAAFAKLAGLLVAGELAARVRGKARSRLEGALAALAMGSFRGRIGPPMNGWASVLCGQATARGDHLEGWTGAVLGTIAAIVVAGPERFGEDLGVTVGDRLFALVGATGGIGAWRGLCNVRAQEEQLAHEAWRRRIFNDLAAPERDNHHFLDPLKAALGDAQGWTEFERTQLGGRLTELHAQLVVAQRRLEDLLVAGQPLRDLQLQLGRLLAPAPVLTFGRRPTRVYAEPGHELEAVRFRLGMIRLGEAIAQRVRDQLPPTLLGRHALQEVQLHVRPGRALTEIAVVQVPYRSAAAKRSQTLLEHASRDAGGTMPASAGPGFSVLVSNLALR